MSLAPPLLEVEHHVQRRLAGASLASPSTAELQAAFTRARSFLQDSDSLFHLVKETLLTDDVGEQKLLLADQEMQHTRVCLDRLEQACASAHHLVLSDRLQAFLRSARQCLGLYSEFAALAGQQPIYSPSPPFDAFIKVGIKRLEGRLEKSVVLARFTELGRELARFQRVVSLLPRLHRLSPDLVSSLQNGLSSLQTGFGAVDQWSRDDNPVALQDGLRLLGSGSTVLVDKLELAESQLAQEKRYSTFRPLEEWLRLRELLRTQPALRTQIPESWVQATAVEVFRAWDYLLARGQELAHNPHLSDSSLEMSSFQAQRQSWHQELSQAPPSDWTLLPIERWTGLAEPLERLQSLVENSHRNSVETMAPFQELPGLEALATLKEQARRGLVDPSILESELKNQLFKVEELLESVSHARDPISAEFRQLLPVHRSAFMGMIENLQRRDWKGLEALWQGVLTTLPHLISLSQGIARRMARQSSNAQRNTCLRCSHANAPDRRVCSGCGAPLVVVVQRAQSIAELGHDTPTSPGAPANLQGMAAIDLLEELVRGVESNRVTRQQTGVAIDALLDDIEKVRKTFGTKVIPLMGQEPTLDLYLRFFAQAMGAYTAALKKMQDFREGASLAQLHSSLAECRDMLIMLEELKSRIDEALRG